MELSTGQIEGQATIDIESLKKALPQPGPFKIFVDTIDETNQVFVDGEVLVVHIARSAYDAAPHKQELVKNRVLMALTDFA